jgi:hypothetical protein
MIPPVHTSLQHVDPRPEISSRPAKVKSRVFIEGLLPRPDSDHQRQSTAI